MEKKVNVLVIFGGRSGEYEVSLESARSVIANLDPSKYEIIQLGISQEGTWMVGQKTISVLETMLSGDLSSLMEAVLLPSPNGGKLFSLKNSLHGQIITLISEVDVIFPVLHGTFGEDGAIQGFLELVDLPYVGAGVLGSAVGMDKGIFKNIMRASKIPVVDGLLVTRSEIQKNIDSVIARVMDLADFPLFVKPANLGSSVGVSKCQSRADLVEGLLEAARYDRRILVERGVEAREIEVSILGNDEPIASMPGEILPSREFYSYEAKYLDGTSGLIIPAPLSEETTNLARELAIRAYRVCDCAGLARVDFLLDKVTEKLFLNEINTIPGFTTISMYPKLWEVSGLNYSALLDRLISLAFERKADGNKTEHRYRRES